jgi:hypothetical protein
MEEHPSADRRHSEQTYRSFTAAATAVTVTTCWHSDRRQSVKVRDIDDVTRLEVTRLEFRERCCCCYRLILRYEDSCIALSHRIVPLSNGWRIKQLLCGSTIEQS